MLTLIPKNALVGAALVSAALLGIYGYGAYKYSQGKRDFVAAVEKARLSAIEDKKRIDDEIDSLSDDDLLRRALGWVRTPAR